MTGVTWDERKPGDWLASNGRWYPEHQRPRGWATLALPPAPGHGGAYQLHSNVSGLDAESFSDRETTSESRRSSYQPPSAQETEPTGVRVPGVEVVRKTRPAADATATHVKTYKHRIERGTNAPAQLPPPSQWRDSAAQSSTSQPPAPPGRVSNDDASPPPPPRPVPARRPAAGNARKSSPPTGGYANDLGRVLGKARKRIEQAIEESAQAGGDR